MGFKNKTKVMLNLPMLCVFLMLRVLLKGRLAYKQRAEKFETSSLQSMIRSHRCWFITNAWKSNHHLNMTLGTDIKFTLSFPSAKSCVDGSECCLVSRLKRLEARSLNTNGQGLSQQLPNCLSVNKLHPRKPGPIAQIRIDASVHVHIFTAWRYTFGNQGFKTMSVCGDSEPSKH